MVRLGGDPFNMTVAALRLSRNANAVAELHGETARKMWRHVDDAAPIVAVTNGVDHRVWQDARVAAAIDDGGDEVLDEARAHAQARAGGGGGAAHRRDARSRDA